MKVSNLCISQVKRKSGIEIGRIITCQNPKIADSLSAQRKGKSDKRCTGALWTDLRYTWRYLHVD